MQRPKRRRPTRGAYAEENDFAVLTDDSCGEESLSDDDEFDSDEDYVVQFIAPTRALLGAQALTRRIASHAQVVRVLCSGHGLCLVWLLSHLTLNCVTLLLGVWVGQG